MSTALMAPRKNKRSNASMAIAKAIIDEYQPSRGGYHAEEFLKGFSGYLTCDGFSDTIS